MAEPVSDLLSATDLEVSRGEVTGAGGATVLASRSVDMAVITMAGLPDPGQGRAYQLWLAGPDPDPIPSDTMESGDVGPTASAREEGIADSAQIGLTAEPAGGYPAPTGDVLLALDVAWSGGRVRPRGSGSGPPPRPQRDVPGLAFAELDRDDLVQLDLVVLEPVLAGAHVEAPQPGLGLADLPARLVPVVDEVGTPVAQRERVVGAQVLLVDHLEPGVLGLEVHGAGTRQFAVREDVAVDKSAGLDGLGVVRAGDAVVEKPP